MKSNQTIDGDIFDGPVHVTATFKTQKKLDKTTINSIRTKLSDSFKASYSINNLDFSRKIVFTFIDPVLVFRIEYIANCNMGNINQSYFDYDEKIKNDEKNIIKLIKVVLTAFDK